MTGVTQLFVVAIVLAGLLGTIGIWAPRRLGVKVAALLTTLLFLPVAYAGLVDLLSKPKPVDLEWWQRQAEEATVLAARLQENDGIYLWLQLPEVAEPRAYVLPWSREQAEQLQEAQRAAEEQGGEVQMRLPFEPSLADQEPQFYAPPPPALPPKELAEPEPQFYQAPERDA